MKYVVKVGNDYVYSIELVNNLIGKHNGYYDLCSKKEDALRFRHKYMAKGFAKLFNGTVEKISID